MEYYLLYPYIKLNNFWYWLKLNLQELLLMVCKNCYNRFCCKLYLDENGRCRVYLKSGEIVFGEELRFDPTDTITYDYNSIRRYMGIDPLDTE